MDKRTATLTLTEKLRESGYVNKVTDPTIKSFILNNARSVILDLEVGKIGFNIKEDPSYSNVNGGNYLFLEGQVKEYKEKHYSSSPAKNQYFVMPVAIIGEVEEKILREKFYKDVPEEISEAFKVLDIHNFIERYAEYYSTSSEKKDNFFDTVYGYIPFKGEMVVEVGDIIKNSWDNDYYLVKEKHHNGSITGQRFKDPTLKILTEDCKTNSVDYIIPIKKNINSLSLIQFIFNLPYEEQNIVANKIILKEYVDSSDLYQILLKEYSEGKHFQEYFKILDKNRQKNIVDEIKKLPDQNIPLNSWLFNKGFHVELDYLELYQEDGKNFIKYFEGSSQEIKEVIISDIFNYEFTNKEVAKFLDKNYSELMRDVSFKKEESEK